jgi:hypothetical protein
MAQMTQAELITKIYAAEVKLGQFTCQNFNICIYVMGRLKSIVDEAK